MKLSDDIERVLISAEELEQINGELAQQLSNDYKDKNPIFVCVLKGAVLFLTDLVRKMDSPVEIEFMDVSSYGDGMESSGDVKILKDLDVSVAGRDVVFIEDIVDTGQTLKYLIELFKTRKAKSVKICTLLDKKENRVANINSDYVGTTVPNEFVVGYGLDFAEKYRNLPYIGVLKPEVYEN
ncbi:hypoxanthine phosphoribosyltransferase [Companilactobacillus sp. RD055328]|uniref:hypoxanthine phosphoribosyltransferase n=1 Tax=Companilactobacillus sp. RD055328 TaxID=2916634 RepID=UPI001FC86809|nr:hypoxanthine phosphoribosyltransferase [Companilactobacillus sp. RD055328]GKQ42284.1 hypoxanthine phosphoribosyltransferase [Companilactobacillus sp. RD055328]